MKNNKVNSNTKIPVVNKWGDRKVLGAHVIRYQRQAGGMYYTEEYIWHCGYVTLKSNHPFVHIYMQNDLDNDSIDDYVKVHGGITFSKRDEYGNLTVGFDLNKNDDDESGINDDASYAIKETESLATQLTDPKIIESALSYQRSKLERQLLSLNQFKY
jgi:hypothetical protein